MHFAVPETQELVDASNSTYVGYNVHINGLLHCTLRYRQFHSLHEELVKEFESVLPAFPPKKLFSLTVNQQEERRIGLDKYLQIIGQTSIIHSSELFTRFFLNAQQELVNGPLENEELDVFISNDFNVKLNISTKLNSKQVLKEVYDHIKLPEKLHSYFSLFIITQEDNNMTVLRKLEDFESPVITYKRMLAPGIRVFLRRNYWDINNDYKLLSDKIGLDLLFYQTVADIENKSILCAKVMSKLTDLRNSGSKLRYVSIAQGLKYYGYLQFAPCLCDFPSSQTEVVVTIGKDEIDMRIPMPNDTLRGTLFNITRIRCWRITTLPSVPSVNECNDHDQFNFELSFEYLFPIQDKLKWVTVSSNQAILMSVCLQSMIDELVLKKKDENKLKRNSWVHVKKDEHSRIIMENELVSNIHGVKQENETQSNVNKLIDVVSSFFLWTLTNRNNNRSVVHKERTEKCSNIVANNPFYMIGDDDL